MPDSGRDIRNIKLYNNLSFSAVNTEAYFVMHSHEYFEIVITLENNYIHTVNGESRQEQNGDAVILRPSDVHSAYPIDELLPHSMRDIYVSRELFGQVCDSLSPSLYTHLLSTPQPPRFHLTANRLSGLNQRLDYPFFIHETARQEQDAEQIEMLKRAITTELLGNCIFEDFISKYHMPECLQKLLESLKNRRFSQLKIEEMAAELGYSHTYLCRQFMSYFGKTIERYLIDMRIDKSIPLLMQTDMSVEQIAHSLGWKKTGNYISAFKRQYGTTPLKYREREKK